MAIQFLIIDVAQLWHIPVIKKMRHQCSLEHISKKILTKEAIALFFFFFFFFFIIKELIVLIQNVREQKR